MNEMDRMDAPNESVTGTDQTVADQDVLKMGAMVDTEIHCAGCDQVVSTENAHCFVDKEGNDLYYCEECKKSIDQALEHETKNPNLIGAVLLGLLAAVVSGIIWCAIEYFTGYTIGYVAIAVGFLIGWGVVIGSGKKRGFTLQIISTMITLITILAASYMTFIFSLHDYLVSEGYNEFLWISPLDPDLLSYVISPMGIFIWAIGIATAFKVPMAKKL